VTCSASLRVFTETKYGKIKVGKIKVKKLEKIGKKWEKNMEKKSGWGQNAFL
jgi:hypothetical protein